PPAPPVITDLRTRAEGVYCTWAPSSSTDVATYEWLRRASGEEEWTVLRSWPPAAPPAALLDATGNSGRLYEYALRCRDESGYDSDLAFILRARAPARLNPVVAQLTAVYEEEKSGIILRWPATAPEDGRYRLYRAVNGDAFDLITSLPASQRSWTDRQITAGMQYEYAIRVSGGGAITSDFGRVVTVTIPGR
ncbi:MAG: hypothetical protein AAGA31_07425, partial [Bacteroidota bacterium]